MTDQLAYLLDQREHLKARAQGWATAERLDKASEECAEFIAAVRRYLRNPSPYLREKLAEEFCGVENSIGNVVDDFAADIEAARPRQLLRLKGALERDGL